MRRWLIGLAALILGGCSDGHGGGSVGPMGAPVARCNDVVSVTMTYPAVDIAVASGSTITVTGYFTDDGGANPCQQDVALIGVPADDVAGGVGRTVDPLEVASWDWTPGDGEWTIRLRVEANVPLEEFLSDPIVVRVQSQIPVGGEMPERTLTATGRALEGVAEVPDRNGVASVPALAKNATASARAGVGSLPARAVEATVRPRSAGAGAPALSVAATASPLSAAAGAEAREIAALLESRTAGATAPE